MNQEDDSDVPVQRKERFQKNALKYLNMLLALVLRLTHDRELSEEISQQTVFKYFSRMEEENWQRDIENEGAYLAQMARNLLNDGWRVQGKTEWVSLDQQLNDRLLKVLSQLRDDTFDIEKQMYFEDLLRTLPWKTIFGNLSDDQKHLLRLHVREEMSYEEIGEAVNKDKIVVKYKLDATYATIRARIKSIFGDTSFI